MPFSTQSEFEHSRKAARRERNPRNAVMKGGDKSIGEEKHSQTVSRKARLTERAGTMLLAGENCKERQLQEEED